ncbi:MAG: homoserine dehydrogenase [Candidatus Aminicenantes bacterium]|nr:homoserine dehydrogenase [Candidatus Aminicenantes bacterium]
MKKKHLRAVFIGFGNVAQRLAAMLTVERNSFPGLKDLQLETVGIFTRQRGALIDPAGIDLGRALEQFREDGSFPAAPVTVLQALQTLDYDVLVELSTLSIADKGEPAISHVRTALERGRHAVTANKGPAAFAYRELAELARKNKAQFLFESAVMDGTPIFSLGRSLQGLSVTGFSGIFNTTTNFVLSRLEAGESMEAAVRTAQRLGFAEADPSLDLEGWDAAAKTAILANVFLGADIDPLQVERRGIGDLAAEAASRVMAAGRRLKLICRAELENGKVRAQVGPEEVPMDHYFAAVSGKGAALRLETDMMGPLWIIQEEPGLSDTAAGVLQDLITVAADR